MSQFSDRANLLATYAEALPKCCNGHCFRRLLNGTYAAETYFSQPERRFIELLNSTDWQGFDIKNAFKVWLATYSERSGMSFGDFVEAMR